MSRESFGGYREPKNSKQDGNRNSGIPAPKNMLRLWQSGQVRPLTIDRWWLLIPLSEECPLTMHCGVLDGIARGLNIKY